MRYVIAKIRNGRFVERLEKGTAIEAGRASDLHVPDNHDVCREAGIGPKKSEADEQRFDRRRKFKKCADTE